MIYRNILMQTETQFFVVVRGGKKKNKKTIASVTFLYRTSRSSGTPQQVKCRPTQRTNPSSPWAPTTSLAEVIPLGDTTVQRYQSDLHGAKPQKTVSKIHCSTPSFPHYLYSKTKCCFFFLKNKVLAESD